MTDEQSPLPELNWLGEYFAFCERTCEMKKAFTLVELLVVITIISMLVGLLTPALLSSRGRARIAQCTNNQHELALAITQYDLAKQRLPGFINRVKGTTVGWVPVLFPFVSRNDLWVSETLPDETVIHGWRDGAPTATSTRPTPRIAQLICPDDADASIDCPLSYVVNVGVYNDTPNNSFHQNGTTGVPVGPGLFRNYSAGGATISLASIQSTSQTVMLSEKRITLVTEPGDPEPATVTPPRQWTTALTDVLLGFSWPNYRPEPLPVPQPTGPMSYYQEMPIGVPYIHPSAPTVKYWPPLPPNHPGIVIVTFADGHTESVSNETECRVYKAVP